MSKITLAPNASGTGILTVAAPNTNSNYTLTLPAETGTVLTSGGAIDVNASAPADSVVINSSGNVGIGTTTLNDRFNLYNSGSVYQRWQNSNTGTGGSDGYQIGIDSSGNAFNWQYENLYLAFGTNNSERMRIDSSGNLLVGTTSPNSSGRIFNVYGSGVLGSFYRNTSTSDDEVFEVRSNVGSTNTQTLKITANGNVTNTNGSYGSYSDIKLKENIVDATPKLEDLMRVRVRNYNLKNNPDQKLLGVVAQELEEVFPNLVEESTDYDNDGNDLGTITKGVKYSIFVPMLIKAIQELKAENDALKSRLDAVEALEARIAALEAGNVPT